MTEKNKNLPQYSWKQVSKIHLAVGAAVAITFSGALYFLNINVATPPTPSVPSLYQILGMITFVLGGILPWAGTMIFPRFLQIRASKTDMDEQAIIQVFMAAHILRMAITQVPAIFGCVILFLIAQEGYGLRFDQVTLLPALPIVLFFSIWFISYPSEVNAQKKIEFFAKSGEKILSKKKGRKRKSKC